MGFLWKSDYACSIEDVNEQHKKLLEIGNRIYDRAMIKDDVDHYDEIMEILEELKAYTVFHFSFEEELMKKSGYDNYENHKIEHDFFIKKVERIGRKDIDRMQMETLLETLGFIADWVTSHILQKDKEMTGKVADLMEKV